MDAPGMKRSVITPGKGTSGEWARSSANDITKAETIQMMVGATPGASLLADGQNSSERGRCTVNVGERIRHPPLRERATRSSTF